MMLLSQDRGFGQRRQGKEVERMRGEREEKEKIKV